ncbi:DEAD/DEAH box helicase [Streptomyces sp. NPDC088350]|uniref:DEAD/DEAH box helicase n=1 Tax=Streptomyces sp. NPDC088350 TaxID=3365854 RepID=UPI0038087C35
MNAVETPGFPGLLQATFVPDARLPGRGRMAFWGTADPAADAASGGLLGPEGGTRALDRLPTLLPRGGRLTDADVPALLVPLSEVLRALAQLAPRDDGTRLDRSVYAWSVAARWALEHVVAGHAIPLLGPGAGAPALAHWRIEPAGDPRLDTLAEALPGAAHALRHAGRSGASTAGTDGSSGERVWSARALLGAFGDAVADTCVRAAAPAALARTPETGGAGTTWAGVWIAALAGDRAETVHPGVPSADDIGRWASAASGERVVGRLCLRLGLPDGPDAPWPLTFHLQAPDAPALLLPAQRVWSSRAPAMALGDRLLDHPQETLTASLGIAARWFRPLAGCLGEARPAQVRLTAVEAADLFGDAGNNLRNAGIEVIVPQELADGGGVLGPRLRVGSRRGGRRGDTAGTRHRTVTYRWEAVVGDEVVTADEVAELAARGEPFALWRGAWVRVDCERVAELAALVGRTGRLSTAEALSVALCGRHRTEEFGDVPAPAEGSVAELVGRLRDALANEEPQLTGVHAELRDYQKRGIAWLQSLTGLGFGALLADDMGLGKTLQTIALLAGRPRDRPQLVVCPTSVVSNWSREAARFAPDLAVIPHHGPRRATRPEEFTPGTVHVTSYALLRLDAELLTSVDWDLVVLDEAQQIKNQAAQTARTACRLTAQARVALTGTPVENRLSELWSIMHFANPGLLGSHHRFKEQIAVPIERDGDTRSAERLRTVTAPFMLRRMKSTVVDELPAKLESTVSCDLTAEQTELYRAAVDEAFDTGQEGLGTGIRRQGNVLRLLTHLKQICNHPAQYLGAEDTDAGQLAGRSGKLERATEMLGEVVAAGERALVFTQYRVMGDLLASHLSAQLGLDRVPFLHGGTPPERRDRMVRDFQDDDGAPPLLLISLKAGGFGLNLTRASHVMHYDRWWNPAVEDQATDRAHRIGQTKTVLVHKLVTADTFEERIDALLQSKRSLADAVVGTGETWLTELDDEALRALVRLADSGDTV